MFQSLFEIFKGLFNEAREELKNDRFMTQLDYLIEYTKHDRNILINANKTVQSTKDYYTEQLN